jgi:predicted anti-sigma-YlaC factor YlaD
MLSLDEVQIKCVEPDSAHRGQIWVERDRKRKLLLRWLTSALSSALLVLLIWGHVRSSPPPPPNP